jgi:energy-coupling factor transport system ATP-binding protein
VLKGVNLSLYKGEILSILGGNGVGKSTLLKAITGIKAVKGDIIRKGTVSLLSQNPELMFVKKTLLEDLKSMRGAGEDNESFEKRLKNVIGLCKLEDLLSRHPFDLSGGEKQRAALSKVLLLNPDILLLDEPTKGLDAEFKKEFKAILKALTDAGISIIMVSHDLEFSASVSDNAAMFFDGNVISKGNVYDFFSQNNFYTTQANRISKEIYDECITVDDILYAMGIYKKEDKGDSKQIYYEKIDIEDNGDRNPLYKLPLWRKILGILTLFATICIFIYTMRLGNLADMITKDGITMKGFSHMAIYSLMVVLLFASVLLLTKSTEKKPDTHKKEKLSKRTKAAVLIILLLIPLTLFIWAAYFDKHSFYPVAFLIMIESMAPFFLIFERRKPKARELVLIAALCAITIASRAAFFMLPQFKPVMAMTIICAVAFGGETGFLVGAVSMLVSNIMFSQGPWTPWQMFSMGIIGFLAGVLYKANLLRRNKLSLALFGAVSAIVIYGGIMNPVTALIWGGSVLNTKMLMAHYLSGFPMDCVHAAATFIFLWIISEPMLEKLDRIKEKYGLIE